MQEKGKLPATLYAKQFYDGGNMRSDKIVNLAISDNGFVFDPTTGYSYNTNELGFFLLKMLQEGHTRADIVQKILEEYEVAPDNLERDLDFFILQMKSLNLMGD
jgi:hypothetical protein